MTDSVVIAQPSNTVVVQQTNTVVVQSENVEVVEVGIQGPPGGGGGGGGGAWGDIIGTLSDQTDLQAALDDKLDADATITENMHGFIEVVRNKTYVVAQKMAYPGTINEATTQSLSGTCTATFNINGTPLGGTANSASSSEQSQTHSSANTFVAGDTVSLVATANAACLDLSYSLKITRSLA